MARKTHSNPNHQSVRRKWNTSTWLLIGGLVLGASAVLALVWLTLTPNRGDGGKPQLQLSTERLELGKQILGSTVHASFDLSNKGKGTLTLSVPQTATALEGC